MTDSEPLRKVFKDLIEVVHLRANELEKLIAHVEQVTTHLSCQFALIASELSGLHHRVKRLGVRHGSDE